MKWWLLRRKPIYGQGKLVTLWGIPFLSKCTLWNFCIGSVVRFLSKNGCVSFESSEAPRDAASWLQNHHGCVQRKFLIPTDGCFVTYYGSIFFLDGLFLQGCIDHQGWRVTPRISELWQWDKCCWIERKELILPVFSKSSLCAVSQTCTPVMSLSAFSIRFRSTPPTTQLWTDNKKHRIQQQNRDWMHSAVFPYRPYRVVYLSLRLSP